MLPKIPPDSFILANRWLLSLPQRSGQIYYLQHPHYGKIVKMLSHINTETVGGLEQKKYWFCGTSPDSISKQSIGAITEKNIIGRVFWIIRSR